MLGKFRMDMSGIHFTLCSYNVLFWVLLHTLIRSILTYPWFEFGGECPISCKQSGYSAKIEFHTKVHVHVYQLINIVKKNVALSTGSPIFIDLIITLHEKGGGAWYDLPRAWHQVEPTSMDSWRLEKPRVLSLSISTFVCRSWVWISRQRHSCCFPVSVELQVHQLDHVHTQMLGRTLDHNSRLRSPYDLWMWGYSDLLCKLQFLTLIIMFRSMNWYF